MGPFVSAAVRPSVGGVRPEGSGGMRKAGFLLMLAALLAGWPVAGRAETAAQVEPAFWQTLHANQRRYPVR